MQILRIAGKMLPPGLLPAAGMMLIAVCAQSQETPAALPEVPLEVEAAAPPAFDPVTNATRPAPAAQTPRAATAIEAVPQEPFMPLEQARDEMRRAFIARDYDRVIELGDKIEQRYHMSSGSDYYTKLAKRRIDAKANPEKDKRPYRRLSDIPTSLDLAAAATAAVPVAGNAAPAKSTGAAKATPAAGAEPTGDVQPVPSADESPMETPEAVAPTPEEAPDRVIALATPPATNTNQTAVIPGQTAPTGVVLEPIKKAPSGPPLKAIIGIVLGLLVVIATVVMLVTRRRGEPELEVSGRITPDSPGLEDSLAPAAAGGPMIFDEDPPEAAFEVEPVQRAGQSDEFEKMFTIEPAPAVAAAPSPPARPYVETDGDSDSPFDRLFEESREAEDPFLVHEPVAPAEDEAPKIDQHVRYPGDHYESFISEDEGAPDESSIDFSGDTSTQVRDLPETHDPLEDSGIIQLDDLMLRDDPPKAEPRMATDLPMAEYGGPSIEDMNTDFNAQTAAPLAFSFDEPRQPTITVEAVPEGEITFDPTVGGGDATETSISLPAIEDTAESTSTSELPSYDQPDVQSFRQDETVEIALQQSSFGIGQADTLGLDPETLPSIPMDMLSAQTQISATVNEPIEPASPAAFVMAPPPPPPPPIESSAAADPMAPPSEDLFDREARMGDVDFANANWAGAVHHFSIAAALRPEAQEIKERLREARRMRKDAQGS